MASWPKYRLETDEDLDTTVTNYDAPVPNDQVQVQVVPYRARPATDGWTPYPYRLVAANLGIGKYDVYTRWLNPNGRKPVDHVGEDNQPSLEII